ncbi:MAG: FIST N-terminal domain-containing protein [Myxococcota bacterium]
MNYVSAYSKNPVTHEAAREVSGALGRDPLRVIVYFAGLAHDGAEIGRVLSEAFPQAHVIGCSTNGEFGNGWHGEGGISALGLGPAVVRKAASALADLTDGVAPGIERACFSLESQIGSPLRELSYKNHVGVVLHEGAKGQEEALNEVLGNRAPQLAIVGGSAGDNLTFEQTWVTRGSQCAHNASAILILDLAVPFKALQACHFLPKAEGVEITRSEPLSRLVHEIDGIPATSFFEKHLGVDQGCLNLSHLFGAPFGLMFEGKPWLRSPVAVEGTSVRFACRIPQGTRLNMMQPSEHIVTHLRGVLRGADSDLGGTGAALLFNCAFRKLEVDRLGVADEYHALLSEIIHAGLHTNGETYLDHLNQTFTGLFFGNH